MSLLPPEAPGWDELTAVPAGDGCRCNPAYSQSCPACDGNLAELELQPDDLGEACIAYDDATELCPRRAETRSPYCLTHQYLSTDRLVAA